jgi:hypothetical protein
VALLFPRRDLVVVNARMGVRERLQDHEGRRGRLLKVRVAVTRPPDRVDGLDDLSVAARLATIPIPAGQVWVIGPCQVAPGNRWGRDLASISGSSSILVNPDGIAFAAGRRPGHEAGVAFWGVAASRHAAPHHCTRWPRLCRPGEGSAAMVTRCDQSAALARCWASRIPRVS